MKLDFGIKLRDYYMVVGYFGKWLVAANEEDEYFVAEEPYHLYDIGTICDSDMKLAPATFLPRQEYEAFKEAFLAGV